VTVTKDLIAEPAAPLRFAMVTDTHVSAARDLAPLSSVYAAIARLAPGFVLHCGDITDTGLPREYDLYQQAVPVALRGRIRHVPGNHDVRWDPTAKGHYHARFGPAPYSFDAGGVHFAGLDLTQALLEPGHCGPTALRWLERDLGRLAAGTPVLLFQHFPVGADHYLVDDQPALLELIARYDVRGIFAGHVHRETVIRLNGLTQVTLGAVLDGPVGYWAEQTAAADGRPVLTISRVTPDGTRCPVAVVPLSADVPVPRGRVVTGAASAGRLPVAVLAEPDVPVRGVSVSAYPQVLAGRRWHELDPGPSGPAAGRWSGAIPAEPGRHLLQVRLRAQDDGCREVSVPFTVPGGALRPRWRLRLSGSVQGGIAASGAVAWAASTGGEVIAVRVAGRGVARLWRVRLGPVYRGPGVDAAARTLFVPSADHLYALDAGTGLTRWRFDAGAPVLSSPVLDGRDEYVVFSAGTQLFALDAATGRLGWRVPDRGFSGGRAACDGRLVYTSAADGYARAHDLRTGREAWSHRMVTGDEHRVALYSGWDNVVALGAGVVVVATVSGSQALDPATGTPRWTLPGGTMYPPAVVLGDGTALFTTEHGVVSRVDLADGTVRWQASLGVRVQNAGLTVAGDSAWVVSAHGRLIRVRLADGQEQGSVQCTLAHCFSAPAITGGTLIVGDQDGFVHGLQLPFSRPGTSPRPRLPSTRKRPR
jgi:outer membrane protein assembly factor BamB